MDSEPKILRVLSSKLAGLSGNWSYQSLHELTQCTTDAMATNNSYNQQSLPVFANYQDALGDSNFDQRQGNYKSFGNRPPKRN